MKKAKWVSLLTTITLPLILSHAQPPAPQVAPEAIQAPPVAPVPTNLSPAVGEVVRLAESGVGEDIIIAYIQNSQAPFEVSADQVLYLRDIGLSSQMITAMLNRDATLRTSQPGQEPPPTVTPPLVPPPSQNEPPPGPEPTYVSTPPPVEVNYFYNDLSPYGTWVVLQGYGWCWQPRTVVLNRGWRPYCDSGRWIYSDCGWYWHSDYSWGWAPFHYGRWFLHERNGWVWTPDTVWAPAWVTWRVAGDNCGWAPLPPHAYFDVRSGWRFNGVSVSVGFDFGLRPNHFTFVGIQDFTQHDLGHRRLPQAEVTKVYNKTTIVNNYTVNNNTIVNNGVPVQKVAAATHTEIRKAKVQDLPVTPGRGVTTRTFERSGSVVYRPILKAPPKPAAVVAQKVDENHPVIQHRTLASLNGAPSTRGSGFSPQTGGRVPFGASSRSSTVTSPAASPRNAAPQAPGTAVTPPVSSSTGPLPESPKTTKPLTTENAPPRAPVFMSPKPAAPSTSVTPPASVAPTAPAKPVEAPRTPTPSTRTFESDSNTRSSPSIVRPRSESLWGSSERSDARPAPVLTTPQNPHVYQPKSYQQANEGRSFGQSQRQSSPGFSGSRGADSSSKTPSPKKND